MWGSFSDTDRISFICVCVCSAGGGGVPHVEEGGGLSSQHWKPMRQSRARETPRFLAGKWVYLL